MFTNKITVSAMFIAVFAVVALAPVAVSQNSVDIATVAAFGSSGGDGGGSGSGGDSGCGSCGSDPSPSPDPDPDPDPEPPVCQFLKANGQTGTLTLPYGHSGDVALTWASVRATGATLTPDGSAVAVNGSKNVTVTEDTTYILRVTNRDGRDTCQVTIDVEEQPAASCDFFEASPDAFYNGTGGNVTLTWETTNAQSVSIAGVGNFAQGDGNTTVGFGVADATGPVTHTYTLTALGVGGNDTCSDTITVYPPEDRPLTCQDVVFEASDTTVPAGTSVNLSWVFTGEVTDAWLVPDVADPMAVNNVDVTVNNTTTYNMYINNAVNQVACPLTVTVDEDPQPITCENNVSFTSSDYSLGRGGADVTLSWTTTGIDSLSITGVSSTNLNDSEVVNVSSDTTYTMSIYKDNNLVDTCPLSINVRTGGGGGHSSSPKCDLDISDEKITKGESVTLTWDTTRAKEVRIEDDHGNVLLDTEDSDDFDGKMTIKPTKDTEYTLFAIRGTREKECEVEVEVENSVTVLETRTHDPRVAGISLTQVPYTGFEAGPALTTIFYTLLTLWGLFVAYVAVIRRKGAGGVSFAGAHDHVDFTDQSVDATNTHESSVAEGYVYEATAEAPTNLPTAQALPKVVGYDAYTEKKTMNQ